MTRQPTTAGAARCATLRTESALCCTMPYDVSNTPPRVRIADSAAARSPRSPKEWVEDPRPQRLSSLPQHQHREISIVSSDVTQHDTHKTHLIH
jgi:hypothetical protein